MEFRATPNDPLDEKARYLREVFRALAPSTQVDPGEALVVDKVTHGETWAVVAAEYEALFGEPSRGGALERILTTAWSEGIDAEASPQVAAQQGQDGPASSAVSAPRQAA